MPLYMTLVGGGAPPPPSHRSTCAREAKPQQNGGRGTYQVAEQVSDSDSWETDDEVWEAEGYQDPWTKADLREEKRKADADPGYLTDVYWTARTAERRYRAATGRFAPKKTFRKRENGKKNVVWQGPTQGSGRPTKGFFIEDHFVSLEHVPDEAILAYFQGKARVQGQQGVHPDMMCFRCGEKGHMAASCKKEKVCYRCKKPGHVRAECRAARSEESAPTWLCVDEAHTTKDLVPEADSTKSQMMGAAFPIFEEIFSSSSSDGSKEEGQPSKEVLKESVPSEADIETTEYRGRDPRPRIIASSKEKSSDQRMKGIERTVKCSGSSLAEVYPGKAQIRAKAKRKAKEELLCEDKAAKGSLARRNLNCRSLRTTAARMRVSSS